MLSKRIIITIVAIYLMVQMVGAAGEYFEPNFGVGIASPAGTLDIAGSGTGEDGICFDGASCMDGWDDVILDISCSSKASCAGTEFEVMDTNAGNKVCCG